MKTISIIIPAYNEEKRIGKTLKEYSEFFKNLKQKKILNFEIIVVINGSKDNTLDIVEEYALNNNEIKYLNFEQVGKGFAIIKGFKKALAGKNDFIGFVDADMSTPPNAFYGLLRNINGNDGIIGDRWDRKSKIDTKQTVLRRFLSRGFNFIVRSLFLLPHRDTQCGAKLFKRAVIKKVLPKLGLSEWNFDVDLLFYMRREHARVISIPTEWNDQKESKVNIKKTPLRMLFSSIRLRLIHSPFSFILRFYSKLPKKIQVGHLFN